MLCFVALLALILLVVIALTEIHVTEVSLVIKARKVRISGILAKRDERPTTTPGTQNPE